MRKFLPVLFILTACEDSIYMDPPGAFTAGDTVEIVGGFYNNCTAVVSQTLSYYKKQSECTQSNPCTTQYALSQLKCKGYEFNKQLSAFEQQLRKSND